MQRGIKYDQFTAGWNGVVAAVALHEVHVDRGVGLCVGISFPPTVSSERQQTARESTDKTHNTHATHLFSASAASSWRRTPTAQRTDSLHMTSSKTLHHHRRQHRQHQDQRQLPPITKQHTTFKWGSIVVVAARPLKTDNPLFSSLLATAGDSTSVCCPCSCGAAGVYIRSF